jgi:alpha-glucosidase
VQRTSEWWREAVVYQVYPRSYADANGDGIGDIPGIRSKVPYIKELGVDAIWLSPHYPSPMLDAGYDVADYRNVWSTFGTLDDIQGLIDDVHAAGMRMFIDIVPNHTSWDHPWFKEALAYPLENDTNVPAKARFAEGPWARYHLLRGQDGGTREPNNWDSVFGGPAWKQVHDANGTATGWWYLHIFDKSQPDLDWTNNEVRAEFRGHLRFWFERGIDGFRIDVAHGLAKKAGYPDCPPLTEDDATAKNPYWDQDALHTVWQEWRAVGDEFDPPRVFVAEAWVKPAARNAMYLRHDELHTGFNFPYLRCAWNADKQRDVIETTMAANALENAPTTWVLENHDVWRAATRYAPIIGDANGDEGGGITTDVGEEVDWQAERDMVTGAKRARANFLSMLALPGTVYMYQGQELGLDEVFDIPSEMRQDPTFITTQGERVGRDGCRVPMPWNNDSESLGFNTGSASWLPQPDSWKKLTASSQDGDSDSMLNLARTALRLRKELAALGGITDDCAPLEWDDEAPADILSYVRPARLGGIAVRCVVNMGSKPVDLPWHGSPLLMSEPHAFVNGLLQPSTSVWLTA